MSIEKQYCVYIITNKPYGTLYTGVTSDLAGRMYQHKNKLAEGFSKKYDLNRLVYFEVHDNPEAAIHREKCIKEWKRQWKINLIEQANSEWRDLYDEIV